MKETFKTIVYTIDVLTKKNRTRENIILFVDFFQTLDRVLDNVNFAINKQMNEDSVAIEVKVYNASMIECVNNIRKYIKKYFTEKIGKDIERLMIDLEYLDYQIQNDFLWNSLNELSFELREKMQRFS